MIHSAKLSNEHVQDLGPLSRLVLWQCWHLRRKIMDICHEWVISCFIFVSFSWNWCLCVFQKSTGIYCLIGDLHRTQEYFPYTIAANIMAGLGCTSSNCTLPLRKSIFLNICRNLSDLWAAMILWLILLQLHSPITGQSVPFIANAFI